MESLTLPNGSKQTLEYDLLNRVKDIYYDDKFSKHINYVKKGEYCSDLISSVWYGKDGVIKDNTKYTYDEKGNITKIYENGTEKVKYTYDELSRLIREDNRELNKTFIYSYDAGGNIVEKFETVYTLNSTENIVKETVTQEDISNDKQEYGFSLRKPSKLTKYGYSATGWKDLLLSLDDEEFEYDSLGNLKTYKSIELKWNYLRNLEKFGDIATYTYNANGIRTHKKVGNAETQFYLNGNKIISQITKQQIIDGEKINEKIDKLLFYYGIDGLTGFNHNGTEYIYKKNIQNDIIGIYDNNGQEIVKYTYDAWGNCITKYLQDDDSYATIDSGYNGTDTSITNRFIAFINPFRYRSYYYDEETKLYYLNSRYYDPQICRFINADDISTLDVTQIALNGLNLYAYCLNNPVNETDENGYFLLWLFITAIFVGSVIGAGTSIINQGINNGWENINWWQVGWNALMGGISGALAVSGLGVVGMTISGATIGLISSVGDNLISGSNFSDWHTWLDIGLSTGLGALFGFLGGAGATNAKSLDIAVNSSKQFLKSAASYDKVLTKIAMGAYKTLAGAAGAKALTRVVLQSTWQTIVKITAWKNFGKGLGLNIFQSILELIKSFIFK